MILVKFFSLDWSWQSLLTNTFFYSRVSSEILYLKPNKCSHFFVDSYRLNLQRLALNSNLENVFYSMVGLTTLSIMSFLGPEGLLRIAINIIFYWQLVFEICRNNFLKSSQAAHKFFIHTRNLLCLNFSWMRHTLNWWNIKHR